ncbi:hypothetical protein [Rhizobacter sp. OV335]|uniref:hypothetical protein n=1 Tax=Rhizobacter sp. OV335 TaxID=1500264 RepID=UPI000916F705|nr:hypothetical protein [Rhizobacter sp. OV335]SHN39618.1 hypothetical protein SAMN02787076_06097 [Rhizobacter sp. OV335]
MSPVLTAQIDQLYKTVYGRSADRYEQAVFVQTLAKQQDKLKSTAAGADDEDDDAKGSEAKAVKGKKAEPSLNPARAAAFVDLVHAVANSNEFTYRF